MLISVVIPTFNRAKQLAHTLDALEQQTLSSREIIVVDDGSSDDTAVLVRQFTDVQYLRHDHRGPAAARNQGARLAQGRFIAFTDDDCIPPATWLEQIVAGYGKYPTVAGIGGPCRAAAGDLQTNLYAQYEWNYERTMLPARSYIQWLTGGKLIWEGVWPGQGDYVGGMDCPSGRSNNISFQLDVFRELKGFDEGFPFAAGEDADLKIRLCLAGHRLLWLDELVVEHHHAYTAQRFRTQHYTYGRGVACLEKKYRGAATPFWRASARLIKRVARLVFQLSRKDERKFAWLKFQAGVYDALGQMAPRDGSRPDTGVPS